MLQAIGLWISLTDFDHIHKKSVKVVAVVGQLKKFQNALLVTWLVVLDKKAKTSPLGNSPLKLLFRQFSNQWVGVLLQRIECPSPHVLIVVSAKRDYLGNNMRKRPP